MAANWYDLVDPTAEQLLECVPHELGERASVILLPTFIVGLYGQNFVNIPELHWHLGYAYSWGLIVGTTLIQVWWFRRKNWL